MTPRRLISALIILGTFGLTGCTSPVQSEPGLLYSGPAGSAEPVAYLVGSGEGSPWPLTTFPFAIDGLRVPNALERWNIPMLIRAKPQTITAEFRAGTYFARAELDLEPEVAKQYVLHFALDAPYLKSATACEFWIAETDSNKTVSLVARAKIQQIPH